MFIVSSTSSKATVTSTVAPSPGRLNPMDLKNALGGLKKTSSGKMEVSEGEKNLWTNYSECKYIIYILLCWNVT